MGHRRGTPFGRRPQRCPGRGDRPLDLSTIAPPQTRMEPPVLDGRTGPTLAALGRVGLQHEERGPLVCREAGLLSLRG